MYSSFLEWCRYCTPNICVPILDKAGSSKHSFDAHETKSAFPYLSLPYPGGMYYEKVLGKPADMVNLESSFFSWQLGSVFFYVLAHSEMEGKTKDPGRVMLNFETTQVKEEFERIRTLGGFVIQKPYQVEVGWFATLADPDGNYFQLVSPFPAE